MTPVLVDLPVGWKRGRVKDVASFSASTIDKKEHDGQIAVRLCNYVDVYYNDLITDDLNFMAATASANEIARFSVRAGDVAITKDSETATDIGIPAYVPEDLPGVVYGYHLYVLRARSDQSGRYLKWLFDSDLVRAELATRANGLTRVGLGQGALGSLPIPIPPVDEQRRIAEFLDRETAQIDELIAKQEQLISTLAERFSAQVNRLAGISASESSTSTAPSLRRVARLSTGGTPSGDEVIQDGGGIPWFRPDDLDETGQVSTATRFISQDHADGLARVEPGSTLVCAIGATLGKLGFVDSACSTNQQITAVTFSDAVVPRFGYYALLAERQQILSLSVGNTLPIINNLRLGAIRVSVPPKDRQREIVRQLDEHSSFVRVLTSRAERAVDLLRERRQALISAAVTGQIDVGGAS